MHEEATFVAFFVRNGPLISCPEWFKLRGGPKQSTTLNA